MHVAGFVARRVNSFSSSRDGQSTFQYYERYSVEVKPPVKHQLAFSMFGDISIILSIKVVKSNH